VSVNLFLLGSKNVAGLDRRKARPKPGWNCELQRESGHGSDLRSYGKSGRNFSCRGMRGDVRSASEAMDEVIGWPGAGELHLAVLHHCARGLEFVLVALDALALDEVRDIEDHLAGFGEAAADFFIERHEEAMHLEADGAGTSLTLALAGSGFAKIGEVLATDLLRIEVREFASATAIIDEDFEMHLGFAAKFFDVIEELSLVGPDGFAEAFVVAEDGTESERKDGGMFETICDDSCVVDPGFLI
jgi:hypothetical protein